MKSQPVRGIACIWGGVLAVFVPVNLLISALMLGIGTRLLITSFDPPPPPPGSGLAERTPSHSIDRSTGDIVIRPQPTEIVR